MSQRNTDKAPRSIKKEPKFCRCQLCHEYFYADTIAKAREACLAHAEQEHPDWSPATVCHCPY